MKNKQHRMSVLMKQLQDKKNAGVPYVLWRITKEQREEIEKRWVTEPVLYSIETKRFNKVNMLPSHLLKELHYSRKAGKRSIVSKLTEKEKELLREYNIRYWPVKFRIYLTGKVKDRKSPKCDIA